MSNQSAFARWAKALAEKDDVLSDILLAYADQSAADLDHIKQVEFPRRVDKVAEGWRSKCDAQQARIAELDADLAEWRNTCEQKTEIMRGHAAEVADLRARIDELEAERHLLGYVRHPFAQEPIAWLYAGGKGVYYQAHEPRTADAFPVFTCLQPAALATPDDLTALREHDNAVIEDCAKFVESGNFLHDESSEARLGKAAAKGIRSLKT